MECAVTIQPSRPTVMAWQPLFGCHRHKDGNTLDAVHDSRARRPCASYGGRNDGEQKLGAAAAAICSIIRVHERIPVLTARPCFNVNYERGKANKTKRASTCCVVNEVGRSSSQESGPASLEDELKDQLEALQEEALHVRDRYNNARARFIRLTEVAQQLRQRATIDINIGSEDNARKVLVDKQKVIRAAELSKKRAQLLEELSTKLGEAISKKETQLIVALSSPQLSSDNEPNVRVIPPKGLGLVSLERDVEMEENPTGPGTAESSGIVYDVHSEGIDRLKDLAAEREEVEVDARQFVGDIGDVLVGQSKISGSAEQGYSADGDFRDKDKDADTTAVETDSSHQNVRLEGKEVEGDSRDTALQPEGSLLWDDYLQGAASTLNPDRGVAETTSVPGIVGAPFDIPDLDDVDSFKAGSAKKEKRDEAFKAGRSNNENPQPNGEEVVGSGQDTDPKDIDTLGQKEAMGANRVVSLFDGGSVLFEDYMLDVDHEVAAVESKLRVFLATAVSSSKDTVDERLQLVGELLEQVHRIRARTSEVVTLFHNRKCNIIFQTHSGEIDFRLGNDNK